MTEMKGELPEKVLVDAREAVRVAMNASPDVCVVHPDMIRRFEEAGLMVTSPPGMTRLTNPCHVMRCDLCGCDVDDAVM